MKTLIKQIFDDLLDIKLKIYNKILILQPKTMSTIVIKPLT